MSALFFLVNRKDKSDGLQSKPHFAKQNVLNYSKYANNICKNGVKI